MAIRGCDVVTTKYIMFGMLNSRFQAELTRILTHWATERNVDGFLMDAPPELLSVPQEMPAAAIIRSVLVEPLHALGKAVFGEMYNLQVPTIAKMLDGGRNTDMGSHGYSVVKGFPSQLADMIASEDASGLEPLLRGTVDIYTGWWVRRVPSRTRAGPPRWPGSRPPSQRCSRTIMSSGWATVALAAARRTIPATVPARPGMSDRAGASGTGRAGRPWRRRSGRCRGVRPCDRGRRGGCSPLPRTWGSTPCCGPAARTAMPSSSC